MLDMDLPEVSVERTSFETFWARSRFKTAVPGLDLGNMVKDAIDEMERDGGIEKSS